MCDMCKKHEIKKYERHLKTHKHEHFSGEIRKIHFSLFHISLCPKAYEKHLRSDKQLVGTGQKIRSDKCQIVYDRNHLHN